jgi:hypothetical protein
VKSAVRCDSLNYFGPKGRVNSDRLFPRRGAGMPGIRVFLGGQEVDALYDEYARLLSLPDALDADSDTARQIAEVNAKLEQHEKAEAELWRAEFEASLPIPIADVVALNQELAHVVARARDRAAEEPAGKDP